MWDSSGIVLHTSCPDLGPRHRSWRWTGCGIGDEETQVGKAGIEPWRATKLTNCSSSSSSAASSSSTSSTAAPSATSTVNPEYAIGGAINPAYYSTSGAFNGSGIAFASQSFSQTIVAGTRGIATIYFQHFDGNIRFVQLSASGEWGAGDPSSIVAPATAAKNSTPLSAVAYAQNGTAYWHVFCKCQSLPRP
jgi:hypothetical protein